MANNIDKLIIVPGHAPFKDSINEVPDDFRKDEYWVLQDFQKGELPTMLSILKLGQDLPSKTTQIFSYFQGDALGTKVKNGVKRLHIRLFMMS